MNISKHLLYGVLILSVYGVYTTGFINRPALASDFLPPSTTLPEYGLQGYERVLINYGDFDTFDKKSEDIQTMEGKGCVLRKRLDYATSFDCPKTQLAVPTSSSGSVPLLGTDLEVQPARYYTYLGYLDDRATGVDRVWEKGVVGEGQVIAVIDGGVDKTHPDLTDCCTGGSGGADTSGHGTFITGMITGSRIEIPYVSTNAYSPALGVAPNSKVAMYNVFQSGSVAPTDDAVSAIESATNAGIRVISISIGSAGCTAKDYSCDSNGYCDTYDPAIANAIHRAMERGVIFVVAAGNAGQAGLGSPGCVSGVLSVGASWADGKEWDGSSKGKAVDILAPGVNVYSTQIGGGYVVSGGTSFSAPYAASVVSLLLSVDPDLTNDEIHSILKSTASPVKCYQPWITPQQHYELYSCSGTPSGLVQSCESVQTREQCKNSYVAWNSEYPYVQCDWTDHCWQFGLACVMPEQSPVIPCADSTVGIIDAYKAYAVVKGIDPIPTTTTTQPVCDPTVLRAGDEVCTTTTLCTDCKPNDSNPLNQLSWVGMAVSGLILFGVGEPFGIKAK